MLPYKVAFEKKLLLPSLFVRSRDFNLRSLFLLLILVLMTGGIVVAQDAGGDDSSSSQGASQGSGQGTTSSSPSDSGQSQSPGHLPLPAATPDASSSMQVTPPSVVLPTPDLPPPTNSLPEASPTPSAEQSATPQPTPVFNPPSAQSLNLPSAQPAGNPDFAPASMGMPNMKLDNDSQTGPGALAGMFDWAKKLRFEAAVRVGTDNNVNSAGGTSLVSVTNAVLVTNNVNVVSLTNKVTQQVTGAAPIASPYVNLNGGVDYRFGAPRLNINLDLTGGVTRYLNPDITKPLQGTMGLGMDVEYRFNPRLVFTFNSSSSYQQQPNITLIGTANNSGYNPYYYSANSFAAAYQWSDLLTTVTRLGLTGSYYPDQTGQGFSNPGFSQSFRYLVKPTTTAVFDYNANYYEYQNSANNSTGQSLLVGFDHIFNPKWFWNFRLGGETRQSQDTTPYFGPSLDSNFSWAFAKRSSISWMAHYGTQPSGQNNASYSTTLNSGLNYSQGIFTKLTFNVGIFYLLSQYPSVSGSAPMPSYTQTNVQANASLSYILNRIISLSLGYQYLKSSSASPLGQEYNRGITYLQVSAGL